MDKTFRSISYQTLLTIISVALMLVITLVVFWHSMGQTLSPLGATDFHSYWYHGHFVRLGENPYRAFFDGSLGSHGVDSKYGVRQ